MPIERRLPPAIVAAILGFGGLSLVLAGFWPGIMTWDSVRQYDQALSGQFDDWHPPAMEALWRLLVPLQQGPLPMFVLQVALYAIGVALLAGWAWRARGGWLSVSIVAIALMPGAVSIMGAVVKDCLMAGAVLAACSILALIGRSPARHSGWRTLGIALLVAASTLRFNAFMATAPLAVALLPPNWRDRWPKFLAALFASIALMISALPIANRLLHAEKSGVELSLVIFDLGGITYHSGIDAFPPIEEVGHPVAANRACYSPVKWDTYSWWVDPICPIEFYGIQDWFAGHRVNPELFWVRAILAHPVAYAAHRWAHFNIATRFLVHDEAEVAGQVPDAPNRWHYRVSDNAARRLVNDYARLFSHTPVEWPIVWIALAWAALVAGADAPLAWLIVPLAASGAAYGLGYAVVSVASELRYHLWTMLAAGLANALLIADVSAGTGVTRRRWLIGYAPAAAVTLLAILWRLMPA